MAMQRIKPPTGAAEQIEDLAGKGIGVKGLAAHFKISPGTLYQWFERYPTLKQGYEIGKELERQKLHNALVSAAEGGKGNVVAAIFLLKARHGYRENDAPQEANKVAITFNLPGAAKPEEYMGRTIDGNATATAKPLPAAVVGRS